MRLESRRAEGTAKAPASVGLVVVNWRTYDLTERCLRSVSLGSVLPAVTVIVDNEAAPERAEALLARFPSVAYLPADENRGFAAAANAGAAAVFGRGVEYLWFLNSDATVERGCLEELLAVASAARDVGAVCGKILQGTSELTCWYAGSRFDPLRFEATHLGQGRGAGWGAARPEAVPFVTGCCMLVPRLAWEAVGPFDESLFAYFEDFDWSWRSRARGFRLMYAPSGRLWHEVSASVRRNAPARAGGWSAPLQVYLATRNSFWMVRRYAGWPQRHVALALRLLGTAYTGAGMLLLWRFRKLASLVRGVLAGLLSPQEPELPARESS